MLGGRTPHFPTAGAAGCGLPAQAYPRVAATMKFPAWRTLRPAPCSAPESWVQPVQAVASRGALSVSKRSLSACERTAAVISARAYGTDSPPAAFTVAAAQLYKANIINHCFIFAKVIKLYRLCTLICSIFSLPELYFGKILLIFVPLSSNGLSCGVMVTQQIFGSVVPGSRSGSSTHTKGRLSRSPFCVIALSISCRRQSGTASAGVFRCHFPDFSGSGFSSSAPPHCVALSSMPVNSSIVSIFSASAVSVLSVFSVSMIE